MRRPPPPPILMHPLLGRVLDFQKEAVPLFPVATFTPKSACGHKGPIKPGSVFECMCCSKGGRDRAPILKACSYRRAGDGDDVPTPDPKAPATAAKPGKVPTRKQKREARYKQILTTDEKAA